MGFLPILKYKALSGVVGNADVLFFSSIVWTGPCVALLETALESAKKEVN